MHRLFRSLVLGLGLVAAPAAGQAGEVQVVDVAVALDGNGTYRFDVSLDHADEGWQHYADRWEVVGPDGSVLATRVLLHPHVGERPFTRSLAGVRIPPTIDRVTVRGHDTAHGTGPAGPVVRLPGRSGSDMGR